MEKRKNIKQSHLQLQNSQIIDSSPPKNDNLIKLIPKTILAKYSHPDDNDYQNVLRCLNNLHNHQKLEELLPLFQQLGADMKIWLNKSITEEKTEYLLGMLQKNVQEGLKKINAQGSSYLNFVNSNRKAEKALKNQTQKKKNNQFDWLTLNTKNQMLKSKLKTKLVQTINEYKNESKLRKVISQGLVLEEEDKIHLQDESIDLFQDDKTKINYQWTMDDEELFLNNIKNYKQKFLQTEFLKNCHRYKFITHSQLKTLAAEEISRKLDKSNKAFLSRQFLLDKYFSTKQNLTQKQMKFILKTSPLLSKCVDKSFVRAAIKNIQYQDIDKMELKIAEEIIEKFQTIRNLVKNSRKMYKQKQNNRVKKRIQIFQREKEEQLVRSNMNEKLEGHKTKLIRNLNFRPNSAITTAANQKINKQNYDSIYEDDRKIGRKMVWPIPLNNNHPSTGLFIKDCSEQVNDEYNQYEKIYLKNVLDNKDKNYTRKSVESQAAMMKFYTGGPKQVGFSQNRGYGFISSGFGTYTSNQNTRVDKSVIKAVCETFKTLEYRKDLLQKLNSMQLVDDQDDQTFSDKKTFSFGKSTIDFFLLQQTKRTKKGDQEDSSNKQQKLPNSTEKAIKDKIIEGREKAKMKVYVKKLLSLAAENAFLSLKALNAKFTSSQINSMDNKGNTALFYATKNRNSDFIDFLLAQKADPNIRCTKGATPLHNAFRSSNYAIICKCLSGPVAPNLNVLDDEGKTPLAYCCRKILEMLGLEEGVVSVNPGEKMNFNNTSLLCLSTEQNGPGTQLQLKFDLKQKKTSKDLLAC